METRYCTSCGRALTDTDAQLGQTTCASCAGSTGGSSTPSGSYQTPTPGDYSPAPGAYSPPPTPGEERDVVGAGRYILNFFLAGFVGLGLSFFLRFRGWLATWISLGVFIVAIIVFVVIAVVAVVQEEREAEAFLEELNEITLDNQAEYTLPVTRAGLLVETDCAAIEPDPTVSDCNAFMEALADANPSLATGIERMKSLRRDIPGSAPEEIDELLSDLIRVLELEYQSNLVLIDGWNNQDSAKWQEGWDLSFEAATESLNVAENALRIVEELEE